MAPNGDCSELANAASPDEANAEADVVDLGFCFSFDFESASLGGFKLPNGEEAEVFENALREGT